MSKPTTQTCQSVNARLSPFPIIVTKKAIPATANTVAKIAMGIADSLVTNAVAQALKIRVPTYIFPVDQKSGSITTILPSGEELTITTRDIDLENVEKLRSMEGISILKHPSEIINKIKHHIESMNNEIL